MKKSQQQQQRPVVMDATGKGAMDATGKGPFLGTLDTSWMDKNVSMRNKESLNPNGGALFSGDPARRAKEQRDLAAAHAANQGQDLPDQEPAHVDEIPDNIVIKKMFHLIVKVMIWLCSVIVVCTMILLLNTTPLQIWLGTLFVFIKKN